MSQLFSPREREELSALLLLNYLYHSIYDPDCPLPTPGEWHELCRRVFREEVMTARAKGLSDRGDCRHCNDDGKEFLRIAKEAERRA